MRKTLAFGLFVAGLLGMAAPAGAQGLFPLALEVRGGASVPTGDLKDLLNAEAGAAYGLNAMLQATSLLGVYAAYERSEFGIDDAAGEGDMVDEGFAFGGKLSLPLGGLISIGPWIRAGAIYNALTRDMDSAAGDFETDRQWGFELGGGVTVPLGLVVSVTPGVRYRSYSPDLALGAEDVGVSYIVADLGLSFSF